MSIITHVNVDLDAVCSVWTIRQYIKGMSNADVKFRNANWDGSEVGSFDIIVDMDAGGKGIKGERKDDMVHSCFAFLMEKYAPPEDRFIFGHMIKFVDIQDSRGSAIDWILPGAPTEVKTMLSSVCHNTTVMALREKLQDDRLVIDRFSEILSGMLMYGKRKLRALQDLENVDFFGSDKQVALVVDCDDTLPRSLFGRGVKAVVYSNSMGIGVLVSNRIPGFRADHPLIRAVVEEAGEISEWFAHIAGFLFCWGSNKSPAPGKSKVDPRKLVEAVAKALEEYSARPVKEEVV